MVTEYGKILRTIRIDRGELLGDMADKLNISSAYLSSIETGNRSVPNNLTDMIISIYKPGKGVEKKLRKAEITGLKEVRVAFENNTPSSRKEAAYLFARTFNNISSEDFEKIRAILERKEDKK